MTVSGCFVAFDNLRFRRFTLALGARVSLRLAVSASTVDVLPRETLVALNHQAFLEESTAMAVHNVFLVVSLWNLFAILCWFLHNFVHHRVDEELVAPHTFDLLDELSSNLFVGVAKLHHRMVLRAVDAEELHDVVEQNLHVVVVQ